MSRLEMPPKEFTEYWLVVTLIKFVILFLVCLWIESSAEMLISWLLLSEIIVPPIAMNAIRKIPISKYFKKLLFRGFSFSFFGELCFGGGMLRRIIFNSSISLAFFHSFQSSAQTRESLFIFCSLSSSLSNGPMFSWPLCS